jgi:arabinogalactan oligomer/maltooligosaccharide transport system substrate-binding protein
MKGMQKLAQSSCYDSNADIFTDAGAIVTGIWNAQAAADHFGDNLGATDLPSFTVDGKSYHLGSYSGNKLIGVKPQTDTKRALLLSLLAQYLTSAECQSQRFEAFEWGPSNLDAQKSEAVQSNPSLAALASQNAYAQPQGNISGSWWDIAKVLGAQAKAATTDAELQAALDAYDEAIAGSLSKSDEELAAWGVIGSICGTSWDTDFPMEAKGDGVFESAVLELKAGEELKVRQGGSWDVNFGSDGFNGANFVIEADGKYIIKLTLTGEKEGSVQVLPVE